jgi:hypothetical protein
MRLPFQKESDSPPTKVDTLLAVLGDGDWHSTGELVRRVGHTFGMAVFRIRRDRTRWCEITCEPHPDKPNQYRYRLTRYHPKT